MLENNKKSLLSALGIILAGIMLFAIILVISVWVYVKKHPECLPTTASVSYVNDVVDENGNKKSFIEIEYWKNKDNTGTECFEFILNGYTDWENNSVLIKGVQFVAEAGANDGLDGFKRYDYDKQGDVAWSAVKELDRSQKFFINIDDTSYAVSLDGSESWTTEEVTAKSFFKGLGSLFIPSLRQNGDITFKEEIKHTTYADLNKMFVTICQNLSTSNVKDGEYKMSLVELSDYFKLWEYDVNKQKFIDCDSQTWNIDYFTTTVKVHNSGLKLASESRFGSVKNDNEYVSENLEQKEYEGIYYVSTLTVDDFTWEYYDTFKVQLKNDEYSIRDYNNVLIPTLKASVLSELKLNGVEKVKVDFNVLLLENLISYPKSCHVLIFNDFLTKTSIETINLECIACSCNVDYVMLKKGV